MKTNKPSRVNRVISFVIFRIIPIIIILIAGWFSYGSVRAIARYMDEQSISNQRLTTYSLTEVAIQATLTTATYTPTATSTNSPTPTQTPTNTPTPSQTPTETATATATASNTPTATLTPEPTTIAQVFFTNTPRPIDVTIPALNTPIPTVVQAEITEITTIPIALSTSTPENAVTATQRPLPTLLIPQSAENNASAPTAIPTIVPAIDRQGYDLVNIVLLGGDSELTGDGIDRTDTMIIVSVNRTTNTVSMVSLPRDLYVYIPGWTMQRLNLAYTRGEQVGWTDGGFGQLRQTIFYNLGINVHYFVKIDLSGFKEIIDTLGGVDLSVDCAIQDQELIGAPPPTEALGPNDEGYYVLPVGFYHLNGEGALWYARSRHSSSDFDRGRRQQQLLRAIWRAARNGGLIIKLPELWSQLTEVVDTNLSFEDMVGLLPYALNLDPDRIEHFTFRRLYHTTPWQPPDGANVQLPNYEPVRELMQAFYTPPSESQVAVINQTIRIFNGTGNANWDRVAADRLAWDGFIAIASGAADNSEYQDTVLIDYSGQTKGSAVDDIVRTLNIRPENIRVEINPNRTSDYDVIIGRNYNSCTEAGVLPVDTSITSGEG